MFFFCFVFFRIIVQIGKKILQIIFLWRDNEVIEGIPAEGAESWKPRVTTSDFTMTALVAYPPGGPRVKPSRGKLFETNFQYETFSGSATYVKLRLKLKTNGLFVHRFLRNVSI